MKLFSKAPDGGETSGVTVIELKFLFSIVILRFSARTREAYHSHAFNAVTLWLWGSVIEHDVDGLIKRWRAGAWKYTPRSKFHKVYAARPAWAISFRGPWVDRWFEKRNGVLYTLTHGRKLLG